MGIRFSRVTVLGLLAFSVVSPAQAATLDGGQTSFDRYDVLTFSVPFLGSAAISDAVFNSTAFEAFGGSPLSLGFTIDSAATDFSYQPIEFTSLIAELRRQGEALISGQIDSLSVVSDALSGTIEHRGSFFYGLGPGEPRSFTLGDFSVGYDPLRVGTSSNGFGTGFYVASQTGLEDILFDVSEIALESFIATEKELQMMMSLRIAPEFGSYLESSGITSDNLTGVLWGRALVQTSYCDLDGSGACDVSDIELILGSLGTIDYRADYDRSGTVDTQDMDQWLTDAGNREIGRPFARGDANLDGRVDAADLNIVGFDWQRPVDGWAGGDFSGNGWVGSEDLNDLAINWQYGVASTATVPEPNCVTPLLTAFVVLATLRTKR